MAKLYCLIVKQAEELCTRPLVLAQPIQPVGTHASYVFAAKRSALACTTHDSPFTTHVDSYE